MNAVQMNVKGDRVEFVSKGAAGAQFIAVTVAERLTDGPVLIYAGDELKPNQRQTSVAIGMSPRAAIALASAIYQAAERAQIKAAD